MNKYFNMPIDELRAMIENGAFHRFTLAEYGEAEFDFVLIVPTGKLHDSGWMMMSFLAFRFDGNAGFPYAYPIGVFDAGSDVVNLDGIGGRGKWDNRKGGYKPLEVHGWAMDMCPNGCLRIFTDARCKLTGSGLSVFELWAERLEGGNRC